MIWIPEMLPKPDVIQLLTHALVFACPSVYEPLGIVNLEAMACATAVVASRVGGIPEVVDGGVTGLLVPPEDPASLADAMNLLLRDPGRADAMGLAGRERAVAEFSWETVAAQTAELYAELSRRLPGPAVTAPGRRAGRRRPRCRRRPWPGCGSRGHPGQGRPGRRPRRTRPARR